MEQYGKTPVDLGLPWSMVDPCWRDAMMVIKGAFEEHARLMNSGPRTGG